MNGLYRLQSRWKIRLPSVYERMLKEGLFDEASASGLRFWDVEWFDPPQIADFQPPEYVIDGLVPFAMQGRGSIWACWPAHVAPAGLPVVLSPRDSNTGEFYSPNFEGFLFRQMIEEMADVQLDDFPAGVEQARSSMLTRIDLLGPYLPADWTTTAASVAMGNFTDQPDGLFGPLSRIEMTAILRRTFTDPRINLEFKQHWEDIQPLGPSGLYKNVTLFGTRLSADLIARTFAKIGATRQSKRPVPLSELKTLAEFALSTCHLTHGDLLFPARFYPISHYNREQLAAVGLFKPPMVSIDCPAEGGETMFAILRELVDIEPAIVTCRGVEPLTNLLASSDPWGDLRWA